MPPALLHQRGRGGAESGGGADCWGRGPLSLPRWWGGGAAVSVLVLGGDAALGKPTAAGELVADGRR